MKKTLFIHIPKTGGTTLSQIFKNHYYESDSAVDLQITSTTADLLKIRDESIAYVTGHIPAMSVDLLNFDKKITILRDPLDTICSILAFIKHMGYQNHLIDSLLKKSEKYIIYTQYFSPGFDFTRFIKERHFGIFKDSYTDYIDETDVDGLLSTISRFDYVLDFYNLDAEIKRLIIAEELFPYSSIPNMRHHDYTADKDSANKLLSKIDLDFYQKAKKLFAKIPVDIDHKFTLYRKQYPAKYGKNLGRHQSTELDLRQVIGAGWGDAEKNEKGAYFRWSEAESSSIEMPICNPGNYVLYLYLYSPPSHSIKSESISITTVGKSEVKSWQHGNFKIFHVYVRLTKPGWIHAKLITTKNNEPIIIRQANPETRTTLNYILSSVILRRIG